MTQSARSVAFHTFGCKVNQYETEELRQQLSLGGFSIVSADGPADVFVINSCSVTADADSSCRQMVRQLLRDNGNSRVIVTGCYAERAPAELEALSPRVEVFGNKEKPLIAMALGVPTACVETAARSGVIALGDRTRAYIKVQDGCDAHCTYCIIPTVRPTLICRDAQIILAEARNLIQKGYREIVLTGVRLGRYVWNDIGLSELVGELVQLPGDFRIRLSSIEITEIPDDLIRLMQRNDKLCPHFHIPLQSGDNEILKRMGRWYTRENYRDRVEQIRQAIPDIALTADVIVGFPGETETHLENTRALLTDQGFSRIHVFRYSVRPGTPAERLSGHVDPRIKAERTRSMNVFDRELRYRYAQRFIGKSIRVLQEVGGGYSQHYVRVRFSQAMAGTFHSFIGREIAPDAQLLA